MENFIKKTSNMKIVLLSKVNLIFLISCQHSSKHRFRKVQSPFMVIIPTNALGFRLYDDL